MSSLGINKSKTLLYLFKSIYIARDINQHFCSEDETQKRTKGQRTNTDIRNNKFIYLFTSTTTIIFQTLLIFLQHGIAH